MLKKMLSSQNRCRLLAVGLLACAVPVHAQSSGPAVSCIVSEKDADGEWVASRYVDGNTGAPVPLRESYRWKPREKTSFGPGMTLRWSLNYDPPRGTAAQKTVPESEVAVVLDFWFDAKQAETPLRAPERSGMHLYRSSDPEQKFTVSGTSLTSFMVWETFNNGNAGTEATIPLDNLLAFGTGMDTLAWNIRTEPDEMGRTDVIAKGVVPVSAMRNKVAMIPKMRRLLDRKVANFRTECHGPMVMGG